MFKKQRLIEIMEQKNISAYKLWKLSGVAQSTISDILNKDDKNPTNRTMQKIADALNISITELFENDNEKNDIDKLEDDMKVLFYKMKNISPADREKLLKMIEIFEMENNE